MEYRVLGPLEIHAAGGEKHALGGAMQQSVLASLLLRAGQTVALERLVDDLWDEPPETAARTIQAYVSRLRHELPQGAIESRPGGYRLVLDDGDLDLETFERRAEEGHRALAAGQHEEAGRLLRSALALWRGPALAGLTSEALRRQAERLEELRLTVLEDRFEADLGCAREAEIVPELKALVAEHPFRERLRAQLMRALDRSGRPRDALALYRETRRLLVDELGMEPGQELRELEQAILRQDAELEVPPLRPSTAPAAPVPVELEPQIEQSAPREVRKTVTILFCDIVDSTGRGESTDPEVVRSRLVRFFDQMKKVIEHHGGTVEKFIGDAVMAVFGIPQLHEDDALRAVRAAIDMRDRLAELNDELEAEYGMPLRSRLGIATGEVIAGDPARGDWFVTGDAVNLAERLERSAAPGEIVLDAQTYRLARDAVEVEALEQLSVKGKAEPLCAYRLVQVTPGVPGHARRLDSAMVGRAGELALLRQAFERAVAERACLLFTVLGAAGVGKSRLLTEFLNELEPEAQVLAGRCLPYGEGITFWPVVEVVKLATGLAEGDRPEEATAKIASALADDEAASLAAERVAGLLGFTETSATSDEGFWGLRKLLESLARRKPLVVVFDDLNWAETTFLDLIEHVADWSRDAPILLVGMARPELLELRSGWAGGKRNATTIFLEPLSDADCDALICNLLGEAALAPGVQARIRDAAEGNPLFVEETLSMLIDDGVLVRRNGSWSVVGDLSPIRVPHSIQLLLASRLDQLEPEERRVLECASVEGDVFHRGLVEALTPAELPPHVDECLGSLVRKELIRPHRATFAGEEAFRFRHALIQEAAYHSVSKETRAALHENCARWLSQKGSEYDELVGFHLEQAVRNRLELGPLDEHGRRLGERASGLLAAGARRAHARGDVAAAAGLFERAAALPSEGRGRVELLLDLGRSHFEAGDFARAEAVLHEASEAAETLGDGALAARALLERSHVSFSIDRGASIADYLAETHAAIASLEQASDDWGLARAWWVVGEMLWLRCEIAAAEDALRRSAEHAERVGAQRDLSRARSYLALAAMDGPTPLEEALVRCRELQEQATGDQVVEAAVGYTIAAGEAMRGRFDAARELAARSTAIYRDLGLRFALAAWCLKPAQVELLAGDPEAAERILRPGYETLAAVGEKVNLSLIAAALAEAVHREGRNEEAERLTVVSEDATSPEDIWSQVAWRCARAKILAAQGEAEEAERLGRAAVDLISGTDALNMRAEAILSLARAVGAAGQGDEAAELVAMALQLYEAKGNVASAAAARELLTPGALTA